MFFAYILRSLKTDKYYVGNTSDLVRRLHEHNEGKTYSTRTGIPWELVYHEEFTSRRDAVARELEIKSQKSRTFIERLISKRKA